MTLFYRKRYTQKAGQFGQMVFSPPTPHNLLLKGHFEYPGTPHIPRADGRHRFVFYKVDEDVAVGKEIEVVICSGLVVPDDVTEGISLTKSGPLLKGAVPGLIEYVPSALEFGKLDRAHHIPPVY